MKKIILLIISVLLVAAPLSAKPQLVKRYEPGARGTVLLFVASMCPCTDAHREMVKRLMADTESRGVDFYCVFSNAGETRDLAEHFFRQLGWDMPYLLDGRGKLAQQFGATNTPQAIVLDGMQQMVYRGPIDDSNRNFGRITKPYLQNALADVIDGRPVQIAEVPPTGCWIVSR